MVRSSTLVEVIVALVIITMFTAMFYSFTGKLKREINVEQKIVAELLITNSVRTTLSDSSYSNADTLVGSIRLVKKVSVLEASKLAMITFSAYNAKNAILVKKNVLVVAKETSFKTSK